MDKVIQQPPLVLFVLHSFALVVLVLYCLAYAKVRKGQGKVQEQQVVGEPAVAYQQNVALEIGGGEKTNNGLYLSIINYEIEVEMM